jgi:predicted CXXCH cytochrome family protein
MEVEILKKFLIVALSLVLVLALAVTANAGVKNTIHDFQSSALSDGFGDGAGRGMCSFCHIPHSSKGDRLWPTPGSDDSAKVGIIGILCASCHGDPGQVYGNTLSPAGQGFGVDRKDDIYATVVTNHVLIDDGVYANNTEQNLSGTAAQMSQQNVWPYCGTQGTPGTAQKIECSSCHNPHSEVPGQSAQTEETDGYYGYGNDYLRASFYNTTTGVAFCEYCHEEKTRGGLGNNTIGTGTHPVGESANAGDTAQADIHIESAERATIYAAQGTTPIVSGVQYDMGIGTGGGDFGNAIADDGIGLHLTRYDTGGVTCQSCHKVHGAPKGANSHTWMRLDTNTRGSYAGSADGVGGAIRLGASDDGDANILAVENDANGGTNGYTAANNSVAVAYTYMTEGRAAGDYNDLCIDCHETTPAVGKNWADFDGIATSIEKDGEEEAVYDVNLDAHPINLAPDGKSESGFELTVQDPDWTIKARWAGGNNIRTGGVNTDLFAANGRWDGNATVTQLRNEIICLTCHSLHDGVNGTPILRSNNATFCSDCHTFMIGEVSHPVNYGSAMQDNPDNAIWPNGDSLPLEDYYQGDTSTGASFNRTDSDTTPMACFTCHAAHDGTDYFMLRVTDDNSRICTGCHTDIAEATDPGFENPANYIAEYAEPAGDRLGSHYTGTVEDSEADSPFGETRWAYTGAWTDTESTPDQTSHWNGTDSTVTSIRMQCQSCHTPHNAAKGLVEANAYDGDATDLGGDGATLTGQVVDDDNATDNAGVQDTEFDIIFDPADPATPMCNTPTTALLLGNNARSKMCATCHWPYGTHVTTIYTVPAKPDPVRDGTRYVVVDGVKTTRNKTRYRDYCTRISNFIISELTAAEEENYQVYDLLANDSLALNAGATIDDETPESPTNFPPLRPGIVPSDSTGEMVCDSCHTPHAAGSAAGAFILDDPDVGGDAAADFTKANQRVAARNYQELCWDCHDK